MAAKLKNYTTSIPEEKTIMEIEKLLTQFRATAILKDYDQDGKINSLSFQIVTKNGVMPFMMPMKATKIAEYLSSQYKNYQKKSKVRNDLDSARRIGWRIIKDWMHSQLSLIQINLATPEQIFLPYLYDYKTSKTLYQSLEDKKFQGMLLEDYSGDDKN